MLVSSWAGAILTDLLPGVGDLGHLSFVNDVSLEIPAPRADQCLDHAGRGQPGGVDEDAGVASVVDAVQLTIDRRRLALRAQASAHRVFAPYPARGNFQSPAESRTRARATSGPATRGGESFVNTKCA